jgi:hypothetical protein
VRRWNIPEVRNKAPQEVAEGADGGRRERRRMSERGSAVTKKGMDVTSPRPPLFGEERQGRD